MSLLIDRKYVLLVSPQLERFKQKEPYLFNCRCKLCGDSKKNKLKSRGYFYRQKNNMFYKCHNCHRSMAIGTFLQQVSPELHREYIMERYKEESAGNVPKPDFSMAKEKPIFNTQKINSPSIDTLPEDHFARQYIANRMIPKEKWKDIFYAEDFKAFVLNLFPECDKKLIEGEKRIVLPFYDEKNILQGLQGRVLDESKVRYITIRARPDMKKVYGLNKIDFKKPIYVVEGPIDSMFLENSIATMDSALYRVADIVGDHDYIFIYDNQPRNKEIVKMVRKSILHGSKVVIMPSGFEAKDINDMVKDGIDVTELLKSRTFQGPRAMLELEMWSKI